MKRLATYGFSVIALGLAIASCGGGDTEKQHIDKELLDPNSSLNTNFDGKIFSIPSPMQTALLLREVNAKFNEKYLNPLDNQSKYSTEMKKALNLGVYGTDLGYLAIFKQNTLSLKYLAAMEKITSDLGLEGAFDKNFMSRFEKNSTNEDSMMVIVSDAFKKSDNFLKSNDRKAVSALILVGGWVESMYIATEINKEKNDQRVVARIGEQQQTLNTIIDILNQYNKDGVNKDLIDSMSKLRAEFDKIMVKYDFVQPKTDAANRVTTLQHKTTVTIDPAVVSAITEQIAAIRSSIIA